MGQPQSSQYSERDRSFARRSFFIRKTAPSLDQTKSYDRKRSKSSSHTEVVPGTQPGGFVKTYFGVSMSLQEEQERCNMQHDILRFVFKGIHLAQLNKPPKRILDVGTGTGVWLRDAATKFPKAYLVGVDIADAFNNQPAPANVSFELGNVLNGLEYPDSYFDYIFQRFMNTGIPSVVWPKVIHELGRLLKRGGTIELTEYLMTMDPPGGSYADRVRSYIYEFYNENGIDIGVGLRLESMIKEELGWSDVFTRIIKIPMGEWAGVSGQLMKQNMQGSLEYALPEAFRHSNTLSKDLENWEELSQRQAVIEGFWREVEEHNVSLQVAIVVAKRPD